MTKRVFILVPAGILMAGLNAADQAKVHDLLPDLIYDVPSTKAVGGKVLIDALVPDNFVESLVTDAFPTWEVIGIIERNPKRGQVTIVDGVETIEPTNIVHKALDQTAITDRMLPIKTYDQDGNETSSTPATLANLAGWFGWTDVT